MESPTAAQPRAPLTLERAEQIEQAAWLDLCTGPSAQRAGVAAQYLGSTLVLTARAIDNWLFNRAISFGLELNAEQVLGDIRAHFSRAGVGRYLVQVAPGASPEARAALRRDLTRHPRSWVKLSRGPSPVIASPSGLCVRRALGADHAAFAEVMRVGFGLPVLADELWRGPLEREAWSCFVAEDGGKVVAAAALFVAGGAGYLGGAATLPAYRGRGAQSALLEQRLRAAFAEGCRAIYSETGEALAGQANTSEENMRRAGLTPIYLRENFVPLDSRRAR